VSLHYSSRHLLQNWCYFTPSCTRGYSNGKSMNLYSEDITLDSGLCNGKIPSPSILTVLLKAMRRIQFHICISRCKTYGMGGAGSSVGIATGYGLDGPGIESRWGARFSASVKTGRRAHPASCTMGTGSFPGRDADPSPFSSAEV
jgi:hypothetical protein